MNSEVLTAAHRDYVTIVSGLPRSGTSMMMHMLAAGGMPILTDNIRHPDADNPNGYYEFERVKERDHSWLLDAYGMAVKMVYLLLYQLPEDYKYRVIFMHRHIGEVIASQDAMLRRQGNQSETLSTVELIELFQNHLSQLQVWLEGRPNFAVLHLNYNQIIKDAFRAAIEIDRFLGAGLDTWAMSRVLDLSLYRQKQL